ncbi:hypothetical protein CLZ_21625 [Methylobacterium sp. CLZ]|nr:hypothetical protein [Methylobacterium sp. CLZ]QIJ76949.1 hypothetical protein CLZ_21625 [Methylobacterium sp. CLZ]
MEDYHIWTSSELSRYLDIYQDLRNRNAAWITTSDALIAIMRSLAPSEQFFETIQRALSNSLMANQYVRLRDAGHSTAEPIRVADVFVDLPLEVLQENNDILHDKDSNQDAIKPEYLRRAGNGLIVEALADVLNNKFVNTTDRDWEGVRPGNRIVIKGGPGQGKSTIGQFLVQKLQAQLLLASGISRLSHEVRRVANAVSSNPVGALHTVNRYPILLPLPAFADRLASVDSHIRHTIIEEVRYIINRDAAPSMSTTSDLREWLKVYPWIVVMDGLDEVPPGDIRTILINEIKSFFLEVSQCNADVVVIVTTREQNYRDELDLDLWDHWSLAKLQPKQAIAYASSLTRHLLPNIEERTRVLTILEEASQVEMTRRLMISPLQITILVALVDLRGSLPGDRWQLFHRYFHVLREREEQKGLWFSEILKRQRRVIEDIHFISGFILHLKGERAGGGSAYFSRDNFKRLVEARLRSEDDDQSSSSVVALATKIDLIARERLVLLSSQITGQVAFDVRSLQEYAAAAFITSGNERSIRLRMSAISGSSHWTHVFQIAASRCFSETSFSFLRDDIVAICRELDDSANDVRDRYCLSGGRLALLLLEDGIASDSPNFRRRIFAHAVHLLRLGDSSIALRLAKIVTSAVTQRCQEELELATQSANEDQYQSSWQMIFRLSEADHDWATQKIIHELTGGSIKIFDAVSSLTGFFINQQIATLVNQLILKVGEQEAAGKLSYSWGDQKRVGSETSMQYAALQLPFRRFHRSNSYLISVRGQGIDCGLTIRILSLKAPAEEFYEDIDLQQLPQWPIVNIGAKFLRSPTKDILAQSLRQLALLDFPPHQFIAWLPWPLASICYTCDSQDDFVESAARAASGLYGDTVDWHEAEERWEQSGLNISDFEQWSISKPIDERIALVGIPFCGNFFTIRGRKYTDLTVLSETICSALEPQRSRIANDLLSSVVQGSNFEIQSSLEVDSVFRLMEFGGNSLYSFSLVKLLQWCNLNPEYSRRLEAAALACKFWPDEMVRPTSTFQSKHLMLLVDFPGLLPVLLSQAEAFDNKAKIIELIEPHRGKYPNSASFNIAFAFLDVINPRHDAVKIEKFVNLLVSIQAEEVTDVDSGVVGEMLSRVAGLDYSLAVTLSTMVAERLLRLNQRRGLQYTISATLNGRKTSIAEEGRWKELQLPTDYFVFSEPKNEVQKERYEYFEDDIPF